MTYVKLWILPTSLFAHFSGLSIHYIRYIRKNDINIDKNRYIFLGLFFYIIYKLIFLDPKNSRFAVRSNRFLTNVHSYVVLYNSEILIMTYVALHRSETDLPWRRCSGRCPRRGRGETRRGTPSLQPSPTHR